MTKPVIGFVGLGPMGGNMGEDLRNKGFDLFAIDCRKSRSARMATPNYSGETPKSITKGTP